MKNFDIYIYIKEGYLKANLFLQTMEITYAFEFDDGELTSSTRKKKIKKEVKICFKKRRQNFKK